MFKEIFFNPKSQELRSGFQVFAFLVISLVLTALFLVLISYLPLAQISGLVFGYAVVAIIDKSFELTAALLASIACVIGLTRRSIKSLGFLPHQGWQRDFGLGLLTAFIMIGLIVLMQMIIGGTAIQWQSPKTALPYFALPLLFALFFIAGSHEEVLFRGFPLQALAINTHPIIAALIMSVPFGLVHLGNPNVSIFSTTNTILAGLWLCLAYFKTKSLWLAIGLHVGWNFTMGAIFGLPVSGITSFSTYAPFKSTSVKYEWFTGGSYGPEGGFSATLLLIIGTLWLYWSNWFKVSPEMAQQFEPPSVKDSYPTNVE